MKNEQRTDVKVGGAFVATVGRMDASFELTGCTCSESQQKLPPPSLSHNLLFKKPNPYIISPFTRRAVPNMNTEELTKVVVKTLDDNKALEITELDVSSLTDVTDRMIICSATSTRHAKALADKIVRQSKECGVRPLGVEGEDQAEWILIDLYDVIVHIMLPEMRDFYSLEKLWSMAETARAQHED